MSIFDKKYLLGGRQGAQATVDLNFLTGTLDPRITFTRAGTGATYFDSTGVMQNAAANVPRFDYSPPTVTNWIRNSTMLGANATGNVFPTFWLHGENTTLTPTIVGVGTETGIPYVDIQISGAATSGNNNIFFDAPAAIQALTGQTWTHSVYLRIVGGSTTNLNQVYVSMQMRDSAGSGLSSFTSNVLASLNGNALAGNRFTLTSALNNASTAFVQPWIQINPQSAAINITLRIGAPQLEQSASANAFVPTSGTFAGSGGVARGLLVEEGRTNLAFPSNALATLFTPAAATLTAASGTAPDGTLTMARLAEAATTAIHSASKTAVTVTASATYTVSVYAQAQQNQYLQLYYDDGTSIGLDANFDLVNGTIARAVTAHSTGTATGAAIQAVGGGVYRCSITGVAGATTSARFGVVLIPAAGSSFAPTYAGNAANGLLVWGAQLEAGAFPTSYIPTVGATVTRAAENTSVALSMPTSLTLATDFMLPVLAPPGVLQGYLVADDGTTANRLSGRVSSSFPQVSSVVSSVATASTANPVITVNSVVKTVFVSNGAAATLTMATNGVAQAPVAGAQPTGLTTLRPGLNNSGGNWFNGWIRRVRYYSRPLSTSELMSVTK